MDLFYYYLYMNRTRDLVERLIIVFLRHASLVCPLNEAKRLRLASDATQIEFYANHVFTMIDQELASLGATYCELRAFR
jgi:hypothetical protein